MSYKDKILAVLAPEEMPAALHQVQPTFLARGLTVLGVVNSTGEVFVDGHVEGEVRGARVIVGEKGSVQGEVIAMEILVYGHVFGTLRGSKMRVFAHGVIEGNIYYQTLSVETGAFVSCDCRKSGSPLAQATDSVIKIAAQPSDDFSRPLDTVFFRTTSKGGSSGSHTLS